MAASPDWPWQSLAEAAAAVKAGAVSPMELTRACLERIERVDRVVHAFVSVDAQGALQDAAKAEREIKAGDYRGPLHGIPIGLKTTTTRQASPPVTGRACSPTGCRRRTLPHGRACGRRARCCSARPP